MFDDLNPSRNKEGISGQAQAPKSVEDIFFAADPIKDNKASKPSPANPPAEPFSQSSSEAGKQGLPAAKPEIFQPKQPISPSAPDTAADQPETGLNRKYFLSGLIVLAAAAVVFGGFWAFARFGKPYLEENQAPETVQPQENQQAGTAEQPGEKIPPVQNGNVPAPAGDGGAPEQEGGQKAAAVPDQPSVLDSDQDGLTDAEEKDIYRTDPNNTDTDGDGLFDREEVKVYKTDPLSKDTDTDGYSDGAEVKNGYNPNGPGKLYEIN